MKLDTAPFKSRPPAAITRLLTQGEVESHILAISETLEAETYRYAELSEAAAIGEADYKFVAARKSVDLSQSSNKMTVGERQSHVDIQCAVEFRAWKLAEAVRQSSKEALLSLRSRLDALRTLSANIRSMT